MKKSLRVIFVDLERGYVNYFRLFFFCICLVVIISYLASTRGNINTHMYLILSGSKFEL